MYLCYLTELIEGGSRGFDPLKCGQDSVFVVRHRFELFAYENRCPHQDSSMAWRKDAYLNNAGDVIVCSAHGAQFEISTGRCTLGPCLGQSLKSVPLTLSENGEVAIVNHYLETITCHSQ